MWSVTRHVTSLRGYHSLILLSLCSLVTVSVSDQYVEQDRHVYGGHVTRVAYQDHHSDYGHYSPRTRRVVVRKKILRPRHRTVEVRDHLSRIDSFKLGQKKDLIKNPVQIILGLGPSC